MIFVFSGTSEGREICEKLAARKAGLICFVATEYGNAVMSPDPCIDVRTGRLNKSEIENLIKKYDPEYIVDATHPHAEIVTKEIQASCEAVNISDRYIRVCRDIDHSREDDGDTVVNVYSCEEAVEAVSDLKDGNILLTTGVKELEKFCTPSLKDRLIVRVLPGMESLSEVYKNGIPTKAVIAMEGPFSQEMNAAIIKQYKASVLVTKNSGSRGGYTEKINACRECGIKAVVINKEKNENGISVDEAVKLIAGNIEKKKHVYLVGTGMCNAEYLTEKAYECIKKSKHIIGAKRMLQFGHTINPNAFMSEEYKSREVLNIIMNSEHENIAVLFSGDTGLCSGAKSVYDILSKRNDIDATIIPGISSVSYFASKTGIQYSDYPFISLHGKDSDYMLKLNESGGFIAICSGLSDIKNVIKSIIAENAKLNNDRETKTDVFSDLNNVNPGNEYQITIGYNLGSESEQILHICSEDDLQRLKEGLYVIAVTR